MRKRKNKKRRFCVVVGIALIALTGFILRVSSTSPVESVYAVQLTEQDITISPDELLLRYFFYVENSQFDAMYDMLTASSQELISRDDFIVRNRNIYTGIQARNIEVTINQMFETDSDTGQKIVVYSLRMDTVAGEIAYDNVATFDLNEDNQFRMRWNSRMIFPGLDESDRVRIITLPARRGNIYDRNGFMLAGPGPASAVGLVPGRMRREEILVPVERDLSEYDNEVYDNETYTPKYVTEFIYYEEDINRLAELLEMAPENVIRRLGASYVRDDTFVLLRNISRDAQDLIDELLTVQGVLINSATVRYYPLGRMAAHLVGYVQNINAEQLEALRDEGYHMNSLIGRAGLESIFEDYLRARDGREIFIVDSQGNRKETLAHIEPVNGRDLHLTIDASIQAKLYYLFAEDNSASVAMNPITGEVLALVSTPSYDPNDFVRGMTVSTWTALSENENLPFFNRFRATFSPGSTMKAITAAIGIEIGAFTHYEDFGPSGRRWQHNESWGGFHVTTVREYAGPANLNNAMAWSDNIYFAKATLRIGANAFVSGLENFGFGERIPFEYGLFSSIISRTGTITSDIQLADSGYGQGEILTNPVHLAVLYAAFVNDGSIIQPRLVRNNQHTTITPEFWIRDAFSPETARIVLESLIYSVEHGTGQAARIPGTNLAGKTGTAELKHAQGERGAELGWFVLMTADEDEPYPLLVVSMVEGVENRGGSGYVVPRVTAVFHFADLLRMAPVYLGFGQWLN